jgi:uncharacterized membrane protein
MRLIRLLKNDLAKEAAEWVENELISLSQAEQICQQYDVDYHQVKNHSYGYNVLIGLGYLFIGIAIIILIGANWDDIPRAVRMGGVISLTMLIQGLGVLKYFKGNGATAVFLLGNMFYGASIILIAQIYHLGEHMPDGVFWWAIGCLPVGVLLKSSWLTLQSLLLALLWFYMEIDMGFYPMLFPLFIGGSIFVLYHGKQSTLLFLAVLVSIASWFEFTLANYWGDGYSYRFHIEHFPVSIALFLFTYVFSHWLGQKPSVMAKDYAAILAVWSLRFGLVLMLIMSFKEPWRELIYDHWTHMTSMWIMVSFISIATLLLAYKVNKLIPVIYILPFYLISLIVAQLSGDSSHAVYFQIMDNLALVIIGVWLIIRGIHTGTSHYFYLGVMTILLTALMRYFDLIGSYIEGALLFSGFAAVLIGAAKFWKRNLSKEALS